MLDNTSITSIMFLYSVSPIHAGSGSSLGVVDQPIQREIITGFPTIYSQGLKGVSREFMLNRLNRGKEKNNAQRIITDIFGPEKDDAADHGGSFSFSEVSLLLFPVRSLAGVFAWITCPLVLARFQFFLNLCGKNPGSFCKSVSDVAMGQALVATNSDLKVGNDQIVLEESSFTILQDEAKSAISVAQYIHDNAWPVAEDNYWKNKLYSKKNGTEKSSLVILNDTDYKDFVELSTDIVTRTAISPETGVVKKGALWVEERLPVESMLYSVITAFDPRVSEADRLPGLENAEGVLNKIKEYFPDGTVIQIGGNQTVGCGLLEVTKIW